jgi:hypothetical protein
VQFITLSASASLLSGFAFSDFGIICMRLVQFVLEVWLRHALTTRFLQKSGQIRPLNSLTVVGLPLLLSVPLLFESWSAVFFESLSLWVSTLALTSQVLFCIRKPLRLPVVWLRLFVLCLITEVIMNIVKAFSYAGLSIWTFWLAGISKLVLTSDFLFFALSRPDENQIL